MEIFSNIKRSLIILVSTFVASHAYAGQKVPQQVSASSSFILGNIGDARNSASTIERLTIEDYGTSMYVVATAASGSTASCVTSDTVAMSQLRGAQTDSQVRVNISAGFCTNVYVNNSSRNTPKI